MGILILVTFSSFSVAESTSSQMTNSTKAAYVVKELGVVRCVQVKKEKINSYDCGRSVNDLIPIGTKVFSIGMDQNFMQIECEKKDSNCWIGKSALEAADGVTLGAVTKGAMKLFADNTGKVPEAETRYSIHEGSIIFLVQKAGDFCEIRFQQFRYPTGEHRTWVSCKDLSFDEKLVEAAKKIEKAWSIPNLTGYAAGIAYLESIVKDKSFALPHAASTMLQGFKEQKYFEDNQACAG